LAATFKKKGGGKRRLRRQKINIIAEQTPQTNRRTRHASSKKAG